MYFMLIFKFVRIKLYIVFSDNFQNHLCFSSYVPTFFSKVIYLHVYFVIKFVIHLSVLYWYLP